MYKAKMLRGQAKGNNITEPISSNPTSRMFLFGNLGETYFFATIASSYLRPSLARCCWCLAAAATSAASRFRALFARRPTSSLGGVSFFLG